MNKNQAAALLMYLQRAHGIIPTTGAEWSVLAGLLGTIEGVANGILTLEVKPAQPSEPRPSSPVPEADKPSAD